MTRTATLTVTALLVGAIAPSAYAEFEPPPCETGQERRVIPGSAVVTRYCGARLATVRTRRGTNFIPVNGSETRYDLQGVVLYSARYGTDALDGVEQEFYASGQKQSSLTWVSGKRSGPATTWYPDGKPKSEVTYRADVADGVETSWFANGTKSAQRAFAGGKLDGVARTWTENGTLVEELTYASGEPAGVWRTWYPDGKPRMDGNKQGQAFTGREFTYFDNGAIWDKRELVGGVKWGKQETWNRDGKWLYGNCEYAGKGIWSAKSSTDLAAMQCLEPEFVAQTCKSLCAHHVACTRQVAPDQVPAGQEQVCTRECSEGITQRLAQAAKVVMLMDRCKASECGAYETCLKQWWFVMQ